MKYVSTRNTDIFTDAPGAVLAGIASDGGLFTVDIWPDFTLEEINGFTDKEYHQVASVVLSKFMEGYTKEELAVFTKEAYSNFSNSEVAPLVYAGDNTWSLELFHGPTCAFKDFALQMLPRLLVSAAEKKEAAGETVILVATSGDTGKAALEGFKNVKGTRIGVFYPDGGVSDVQRLQMTTQEGDNVKVFAIKGNFDDAQSGVKAIFNDKDFASRIAKEGKALSSANSINWGRLAPQIAYYFWAYSRLVKNGNIKLGDKVDFCVPTGNFGNILAGYFAKKSGLPIERLVCASNKNDVLTDFFETGVYDRNRTLYLTGSPSMDILVSSNLERLLFILCGADKTAEYMLKLAKDGKYEIDAETKEKLKSEGFIAFRADDEAAAEEIRYRFSGNEKYLCDPHTAVAMRAAKMAGTSDRPMVVVSTASPFKFASTMIEALNGEETVGGVEVLEKLEKITGHKAPSQLSSLKDKKERFNTVIGKEEMLHQVERWIMEK